MDARTENTKEDAVEDIWRSSLYEILQPFI